MDISSHSKRERERIIIVLWRNCPQIVCEWWLSFFLSLFLSFVVFVCACECDFFTSLLLPRNHSINRFDIDCYFKYWKFPQVLCNWNWNLCNHSIQVSMFDKLLIEFHFQLKRVETALRFCAFVWKCRCEEQIRNT